ncbi:MAG: hypothetical protein Q8S84_04495 [bacterium]|nr:hypothetical protein [bacterium]
MGDLLVLNKSFIVSFLLLLNSTASFLFEKINHILKKLMSNE